MSSVYNKLVRDKVPDIIERSGNYPITTSIKDKEELKELLLIKLGEEVREVRMSRGQDTDELVDVYEVLKSLVELKGLKWNNFLRAVNKKAEERGSFKDGILLVEVED